MPERMSEAIVAWTRDEVGVVKGGKLLGAN
jgi:hypothetical protein